MGIRNNVYICWPLCAATKVGFLRDGWALVVFWRFFWFIFRAVSYDICLFVSYRLKCARGCLLLSRDKWYVALLPSLHSLALLFSCGVIINTFCFVADFLLRKPGKKLFDSC